MEAFQVLRLLGEKGSPLCGLVLQRVDESQFRRVGFFAAVGKIGIGV